MSKLDKLFSAFTAAGWEGYAAGDAPGKPEFARAMGSALFVFVNLAIPGATWRIRIGERVCHLERRAHGTPSGRCSAGHWEAVGTIDTPRTLALWRSMIEALTGEALAFESVIQSGGFETRAASQHSRRSSADGSEYGGTAHGRGRVGKSNPTRLGAFGFSPAAGFSLLAGIGETIDANPECTVAAHATRLGLRSVSARIRSARNLKRNAKRRARYARKGGN